MQTENLAQLSTEKAIEQLKNESIPKHSLELNDNKRCGVKADKTVLDDWNDSCEGAQCYLIIGHDGNHMALDGANGYVYFDNSQILI